MPMKQQHFCRNFNYAIFQFSRQSHVMWYNDFIKGVTFSNKIKHALDQSQVSKMPMFQLYHLGYHSGHAKPCLRTKTTVSLQIFRPGQGPETLIQHKPHPKASAEKLHDPQAQHMHTFLEIENTLSYPKSN